MHLADLCAVLHHMALKYVPRRTPTIHPHEPHSLAVWRCRCDVFCVHLRVVVLKSPGLNADSFDPSDGLLMYACRIVVYTAFGSCFGAVAVVGGGRCRSEPSSRKRGRRRLWRG